MARLVTRRTIFIGSALAMLLCVMCLAGVVYRSIQGEPFTWTPGVYAAIGFFLVAVINLNNLRWIK
jgi:hypothetical protein